MEYAAFSLSIVALIAGIFALYTALSDKKRHSH